MRTFSYALILVVVLALDMVSDLFLRPGKESIANDWDITATLFIVVCLGLIAADLMNHLIVNLRKKE